MVEFCAIDATFCRAPRPSMRPRFAAAASVEEAANYHYELSLSLNITLESEYGMDNRVQVGPGDSVVYNLDGGIQRVQWRTWDMRDNWMNLADFNIGDPQFEVTHGLLVDRLKYLPNNTIEGEQVILCLLYTSPSQRDS